TPHRVLEGTAAGDRFGISVAGAGDVNGDGFADLVVGAYFSSPGGRMSTGTASMYLGSGGGISSTPHRVLEGTTPGDCFGISVAGAGDVNGDGFADLIVGAYLASPGGRPNAGTASVYLGSGSGISSTSHRVFQGTAGGDSFGISVASRDDVQREGLGRIVCLN